MIKCILICRKPKNIYIYVIVIYIYFTFLNWYKYSTLSFHAPTLSLISPADQIRTEYNAPLLNIKDCGFPSLKQPSFLFLLFWFSGLGSLLSRVQIEISNSRTHGIFTRKFSSLSFLNSLTPNQVEMVEENQQTPFQWKNIVQLKGSQSRWS